MANPETEIRIGTRKSKLAMVQAEMVRDLLLKTNEQLRPVLHPMSTSGDETLNVALADVGGKGLFIKELDAALMRDDIDIAVHSMKDLEPQLAEGTEIIAVLPREDPRDALLISGKITGARSLEDLPHGATLGTASVRRTAIASALRPDLKTVLFRGNVQTRMKKLADGVADATILAAAGLKRLGLEAGANDLMPTDVWVPAATQGIIAITAQSNRPDLKAAFASINCASTQLQATLERSVVKAIGGDCHTPLGVYAEINGASAKIIGAFHNGQTLVRASVEGEPSAELAQQLADKLLA